MTVKLAVLLSGGGRTLQNLIDEIAAGRLDAKIEVVISSRPGVEGIERARRARIPTELIEWQRFGNDGDFSSAITGVIERYEIDLVLGAGFLRRYLFPPKFKGCVLNIHPALLPKYGGQGMYGHHVHDAVLASGDAESGCTVHIADLEYDEGPVLVQKRVPVLPGDTADSLAERVFRAECEAYPEAIRLMAERLKAESRA